MLQNNICDYIFWDLNVLSPQKQLNMFLGKKLPLQVKETIGKTTILQGAF